MSKKNEVITQIAHNILGFETLESKQSGESDFKEVAVWSVKEALEKAYIAGATLKSTRAQEESKRPIKMVAIAANVDAMLDLLVTAVSCVKEAQIAIQTGEQNQAIGGMLDLERALPQANSLFSAILALHRNA